MATSATPVRHVIVPLRRSPRLLAQHLLPGPSSCSLIGLLGVDQANSQSVGGVGVKRSYCDELGYSAPSKRPRTQPSHCRFIDSLMLSLRP
ncbi:MAG: hypothetical protein MJE68_14680 [Proteobacteria bacterium]|nr:hypothetical protein [Pseudomonadota bacterium]